MTALDKEKTLELLKEIKHIEDVNRVIMIIEKTGALDVEAIPVKEISNDELNILWLSGVGIEKDKEK